MNKHERHIAGRKVAVRRAKEWGWTETFDQLPEKTKKAFQTTGYGIKDRGGRKGFHSHGSGRKHGHKTGCCTAGFSKKDLLKRAIIRSHDTNPLTVEA